MICYKDKEFCPFWKDCKSGSNCERALTEQVKIDADIWWGGTSAPICVCCTPYDCFIERKE